MTTRYQVFVSSTFTDLVRARQLVSLALQQMDCIPAGMELFPAADTEQFEFIKKVIDDSDYYVLIIAGRYGSTTADGISFTEREFDYAVDSRKPVLAFVHGKPGQLPMDQSELDRALRERLQAFRDKVCGCRLVKMWNDEAELPGLVMPALLQTIKTHPSPGWVRGPGTDTTELLRQLNDLRQANDALRVELETRPRQEPEVIDLADADDCLLVEGSCYPRMMSSDDQRFWQRTLSWNQILAILGPELLEWKHDQSVNRELATSISREVTGWREPYGAQLASETFKTIRIQLLALGYVDIKSLKSTGGGMNLYWNLTAKGRRVLMQVRTVKKGTK